MRNARIVVGAVSVVVLALAAQAAMAQGAPPAPPPPPPPAGQPAPPPEAAPAPPPVAPAPTTSATPGAPPDAPPPADTAAPEPPAAPPPPPPPAAPPSVAAPPPPPPPIAAKPAAPPEADEAERPKPPSSTFAIEAMAGAGGRLGHTTSGYSDDARGGLLYGGGLFFSPSRMVALGLSYTRQVGAWEQYQGEASFASAKVSRTYQSVLANVRAYPYRSDTFGLWGGLMLGATFQTARATGTDAATNGPLISPQSYAIDAGPKGGMALGLGVGFDYDVTNEIGFLTSISLMNHWLTADSMTAAPERPVPGTGTATIMDIRMAFQYRFDTSGAAIPAKATVTTGMR